MLDSSGEAASFEDDVRDIAATNTMAGAQAKNILDFVFGEEVSLLWEERDDTSSSKRSVMEEPVKYQKQPQLITSIYPNPASSSITIEYIWDGDEPIAVEFYDLLGSRVAKVSLLKGQSKAVLDVSNLPSGTYIYRTVSQNASNQSGKIVILR